MKILLLGAGGQLGGEWKHLLSKSRQRNKKKFGFSSLKLSAYNSAGLDITNAPKLEEVTKQQRPEVIINCAAYTRVDKAEEQREKTRKVNAEAVKNIAEICKEYKVKLVHYSTDYIFSGRKSDFKAFPEGYPEDHQARPVNWYGQTKWEGEQAIRNSNCEHLILRLSWLCGACGKNFVKSMLQLAETNERLSVVEDQKGSPTFTESAVKNTLALIKNNKNGTFHLSSSGIISWATFAKSIFNETGKEVEIERVTSEQFPTVAKRPRFSKLSTQKAAQVEGVKIENWQEGLKKMLGTMKNSASWRPYHI